MNKSPGTGKNSNRTPKKGDIWRRQLHSEVVNLRDEKRLKEEKAQEKNRNSADFYTRTIQDINVQKKNSASSENEYKNLLGKTIDEQYSAHYLTKAKTSQTEPKNTDNIISPVSLVEHFYSGEISKEELSKELSAFDEHDLRIQKILADKAFVQDEPSTSEHEEYIESTNIEPEESENAYNDIIAEEMEEAPEQEYIRPKISLIPNSAPIKYPAKDAPEESIDQNKNTNKAEPSFSKKKAKTLVSASSLLPRIFRPQILTRTNTHSNKKVALKKAVALITLSGILATGAGSVFMYFKLLDLRQESETQARAAYSFMRQGKEDLFNFDSTSAEDNFLKAREEFRKIEEGFGFFGRDFLKIAAQFPIQSSTSSAVHLFRAGSLFSDAGYEASLALGLVQNSNILDGGGDSDQYLTENLIQAAMSLQKARELLNEANGELSYVRPEDIPEEFQGEISAVQVEANKIEHLFEEAFSSMDVILSFMGHQEPKKYMLAFQNSTELRATGGFIGSYGLLDINKGNMENIFIDGIYNPDGQLKEKSIFIIPPKPLQYVTPHWGTRDANWFYDFPTSAEKVMEFYVKTGGPETDGVVGMTPRVIEDLLELTGPIDMPEYGVVLDSNNFLELVQKEVEEDYDKELNRPKKILSDMAPILTERLANSDEKIKIFNILLSALEEKDILIYSRDKDVQEFVSARGWDGAIDDTESDTKTIADYMAVVVSNIGGWKTDKYTKTEIDTVTVINNKGEMIRTVLISRKHDGGNTGYKWYDKPNYGYIRLYTPKGSELISAEGFSEEPPYINTNYEKEGYLADEDVLNIERTKWQHESGTDVFEESGKTVFGSWLHVPAGERKLVKITYKLPFDVSKDISSYRLTIQKQSGLNAFYSGSIEELHDNVSFDLCEINGESRFKRDFRFEQDKDTVITCSGE